MDSRGCKYGSWRLKVYIAEITSMDVGKLKTNKDNICAILKE